MTAQTCHRIRAIAAEMGFRPNAMARGLIARRSFGVGLLTNDGDGRFSMPVMSGISQALLPGGVSVFICGIEDDPVLAQTHPDAMLDKQVDGIICTGKRSDRRLPLDLSGVRVAIVDAITEGTRGLRLPRVRRRTGRARCLPRQGRVSEEYMTHAFKPTLVRLAAMAQ